MTSHVIIGLGDRLRFQPQSVTRDSHRRFSSSCGGNIVLDDYVRSILLDGLANATRPDGQIMSVIILHYHHVYDQQLESHMTFDMSSTLQGQSKESKQHTQR